MNSSLLIRDRLRLLSSKKRLIGEMIYGIQAAKDIKLSSITRSLNEPIALIKTEDRLSRNLDDRDFTDQINKEICRLASKKVLDDMVIAIDPGDIRKKHASKMECLCKIHDGSEHEISECATIRAYAIWWYSLLRWPTLRQSILETT